MEYIYISLLKRLQSLFKREWECFLFIFDYKGGWFLIRSIFSYRVKVGAQS